MSDKQLTLESNFFSYLEPGDVVLADRGFTIADMWQSMAQSWRYLPSHELKNNLYSERLSSQNSCLWYASM